jgi:V8-like Glu-specific endopeptidase
MWKRFVVIISALAALAAVFGVVALAASVVGKVAATSAPAGPVGTPIVNQQPPQSTEQYWTPDRLAAAKPMERTRDDAAPQSFGTSGLDFTRSRITPQTANKQPPYKGAGKLFFTEPGVGDFVCSASIIGKRLIVTAGHCLFGNGNYFTNWQFVPAFDGSKAELSAQRPFGTWNWAAALVPENYRTTSSTVVNNYDFGIIQLADQSFGGGLMTVFGKVKFKFETAVGHLFNTAVSMLGYPCNLDSCNIMQRVDSSDHRGSGVPSGSNGDTAYEYGSDMTGGSSGGPWVENLGNPASAAPSGSFNLRNTVVAVTSYGYNDANVRAQGASQFNADFTSIKNTMCAFTAGNC